jgi:hypothetical protein
MAARRIDPEGAQGVSGEHRRDLRSAVEHMTGRRVVAFLSETHIDPSFSVEFFRLAPQR